MPNDLLFFFFFHKSPLLPLTLGKEVYFVSAVFWLEVCPVGLLALLPLSSQSGSCFKHILPVLRILLEEESIWISFCLTLHHWFDHLWAWSLHPLSVLGSVVIVWAPRRRDLCRTTTFSFFCHKYTCIYVCTCWQWVWVKSLDHLDSQNGYGMA